jgi:glycosyltransferase involved in cell wall biosynthesis
VVTFDADGQHRAEDLPRIVEALVAHDADIVIGSRFCEKGKYVTSPMRRLGQQFFSHLTQVLIGRRIYDTSSGFKALSRRASELIVGATFMDFHIETIVRASMFGLNVVEVPIEVNERVYGQSMHSLASTFQYPTQTIVLTIVAAMDAILARRSH